MLPKVSVLVLNWNSKAITLQCLESLDKLDYPKECMCLVVIDNASTDGSIAAVQEAYPDVQLIVNPENLGYAGGNNVGIKQALDEHAELILLLNNDTLVDSPMLSSLVATLEENPKAAIAGPMVYHANEPHIIQSAGGTLDQAWHGWHAGHNQVDRGQYDRARSVEWLSGCALLIRAAAIQQVGFLDERFYSYYEDLDWCIRMRAVGWDILHVPQAKLWHFGVQRLYSPPPSVTYYMTRNHLLLLLKHHAHFLTWWNGLAVNLCLLINWSLNPKWRSMKNHRNALWRGMVDFLGQRWGRTAAG